LKVKLKGELAMGRRYRGYSKSTPYRVKTQEEKDLERERRVKNGGHPKHSYLNNKFSHERRASEEAGWDYPIHISVESILKRFENNHNRKDFDGTDEEYWALIKKAVIIVCRMAEYYREDTIDYERYKFDNIKVSGGGGGGDEYTIFAMRNVAFWQMTFGDVYINFKEKTLKVWMHHWEDEGKNFFRDKKEYKKPIKNVDHLLEMYKLKYYWDK
jgi:hypothetical protein